MSALAEISRRVQSTTALIEEHQRSLRPDSPRSALANIRSLEKLRKRLEHEFEEAAAQEEVDVYRYRLFNEGRTTLDGITQAWLEFERVLNVAYSSLKGGGAKKEKKKRGRRKEEIEAPSIPYLRLGFGYAFSGSVRVTLTLPKVEAGLFADPAIEQATIEIFELANSYKNTERLRELARRYGPEPVEAMYSWVNAHVENGFGLELQWRRDDAHERKMALQNEELQVLRQGLSQTTVEQHLELTGDLVAVNSIAQTFTFISDDGEQISGSYEDAISKEQAARVPARCSAQITKTTRIVVLEEGTPKDTFFLKSVEAL